MQASEYRDIFRNWDRASWVRSKPVRAGEVAGLPFSRRLEPLASHPALAGREPLVARLLAYRLLAHLKFTTVLELEHINPMCALIGQGAGPFALDEAQRDDALRIYCDEAGHALFVELLARKVEDTFEVDRRVLGAPGFVRALADLRAGWAPTLSLRLLRLFFVAVAETLIGPLLRDLARDPDVAPVVRAVLGDHAADEATHAAFFEWYFPRLWDRLRPAEREAMARVLPEMAWAILGPDQGCERDALASFGFCEREAVTIVEEAYATVDVAGRLRRAVQPMLRMFESAGVFRHAAAVDACVARGLLAAEKAA